MARTRMEKKRREGKKVSPYRQVELELLQVTRGAGSEIKGGKKKGSRRGKGDDSSKGENRKLKIPG